MRGKKKDPQFVSDFVSSCVMEGLEDATSILKKAKDRISYCDQQIKNMEQLRIERSKLMDVVEAFETPVKNSKSTDARILSFLKIKNIKACKYLCTKLVIKGEISLDSYFGVYTKQDINFAIKQLIEQKIIARVNNSLIRGELFADFFRFVS